MDKLVERNRDVYSEAITARDSAQSLSDQAVVARTERDRLQQEAEAKMIAAQQAADAAQAALDEQQARQSELEAQLAALQDNSAKTIAAVRRGRARPQGGGGGERAPRPPRRAKGRSRAHRPRAAAAAVAGRRRRRERRRSCRRIRLGAPLVGMAELRLRCPHRAVRPAATARADSTTASTSRRVRRGHLRGHAGRVVYAGYNGGYGNYIKIDHGGGIGTGYGHIRPGGFFVGYGQWVRAGQLIASEGNTGNSFGCHLHFETYVNGFPVNPVPFMAAARHLGLTGPSHLRRPRGRMPQRPPPQKRSVVRGSTARRPHPASRSGPRAP